MSFNDSLDGVVPNLLSSTPDILENDNLFPQGRPITRLINYQIEVPAEPKQYAHEVSKASILSKPLSQKHNLNSNVSKTRKFDMSFSDLPGDIHVTIAEHCERGDLPNLCSITKWMHKSCAHVLYCNVDLSLHNRGIVTIHDLDDDEIKQIWSDNSACNSLEEDLRHRQMIFLEALTRRPEYAVHIHKLSWSIQMLENIAVDRDKQELPSWTENPAGILQHIWKVLQLLTNVREIDIAWLNEPHRVYAYKPSLPSYLFPSATSVSLVGVMARPFPALILKSISLSNLQHLTMSNLQDCIEASHPTNSQVFLAPVGRTAETTLGLLSTLTGHCTSLRSFTLRTVAPAASHPFDATFFANSRYTDYAAFIRSVAPTLENLTFEQGPPAFLYDPTNPHVCKLHATMWEGLAPGLAQQIQAEQDAARAEGGWWASSGGTFREMDRLFGRIILKAMVEGGEAGEWACLKEVEMRGVGAWDDAW